MNKAEIVKELIRARAAETTIKNNIIELLEQLVEAEKPKLRHGDFGETKHGDSRLVIEKTNNVLTLAGCAGLGNCAETVDDMRNEGFILGNIFDLLKEWSEDLEEFKVETETGREILFSRIGLRIGIRDTIKEVQIGANLTLPELEEIWHKLGQKIAEAKRKQSK